MSLRQLQRKSATILRDCGLLQALRSEINHELSSSSPPPFPSPQVGSSVGDFTLEWDDPKTQDVVLRRRHGGAAEEIAVSALFAPLRFEGENPMPRNALMKVCVKKPRSEPVLRFDCSVFRLGGGEEMEVDDGDFGADFCVQSAYYYRSVDSLGEFKYKGPRFSSLDPRLQRAWKEYLIARGIDVELTSFLLQHLHKKEHGQYVNWLRTLEGVITKNA